MTITTTTATTASECTCGVWCVGYTMPPCPAHSGWWSITPPSVPGLLLGPPAPLESPRLELSDEDVRRIAEEVARQLSSATRMPLLVDDFDRSG